MAGPLAIRCISLALAAAICATLSSAAFVWVTYSLGFTHYLLAFVYSRRQVSDVLRTPPQPVPVVALVALAVGLYLTDFPLVAYFGLHHAVNEAYAERPSNSTRSRDAGRLAASGVVFHLVAYCFILRGATAFRWVDPGWAGAALILSVAWFLGERVQTWPKGTVWQVLDSFAAELGSLALVTVSFFVDLEFLQVVLYHFVLWAVLPIGRLRTQGHRTLLTYVCLTLLAVSAALALSPYGLESTRIRTVVFSEQFLFWSYVHITISFALSDAHPRWVTRLFRNRGRAAPLSTHAGGS